MLHENESTTSGRRRAVGGAPGTGGRRPVRRIEAARAAWGLALLVAPGPVLERVHGIRADHRAVVVARILGARHLAQAVVTGLTPSRPALALGSAVDALHATTAVGLAVVDRDRARAGLLDAGLATAWALAGLRDLRATSRP